MAGIKARIVSRLFSRAIAARSPAATTNKSEIVAYRVWPPSIAPATGALEMADDRALAPGIAAMHTQGRAGYALTMRAWIVATIATSRTAAPMAGPDQTVEPR